MQSILWNTIFKEIKFRFRLRQGKQNVYLLFVEMKFWKTLIEFELMESWRFENVVQSKKSCHCCIYVRIKKNQSHFDWMKWWCRVSSSLQMEANGNGWRNIAGTDFKSKPRYKKTMIEPIYHETDYTVPAATKTSTLHFCKQLISKFDGTNRTRLNSFQAQIWDYNGWALTLILSWIKKKENAMSVQMLAAFWKSNK